jgi:hypothetical protein
MKLNLGCGPNKVPGYVNVDKYGEPDLRHDLEQFPWPWPSDAVDEVLASHVLEHLGQTPEAFIGVMKELYRVCRHGAEVRIAVPHPRHDDFLGDPTHVRAITPMTLALFSRRQNLAWVEKGGSNTTLALFHGVDFETRKVALVLEEPYLSEFKAGRIPQAQIDELARQRNNVVRELRFVLEVIKR